MDYLMNTKNSWFKGHGLGNDYIVFNEDMINFAFDKQRIMKICDRHYGVGSDGILLKVKSSKADFGLKIFNPDGSLAEKSGNGLRIFADFLYTFKYATTNKFTIEVGNGVVTCEIIDCEGNVTNTLVDIGKANFKSREIPVICDEEQAIDIPIDINGEVLHFSMVSLGNPHAVCIVSSLSKEKILEVGSIVENYDIFPHRINVQMVEIIDKENVKIEIWERGAGYTLASGSSSCAVASILLKKGLINNNVNVHMPGGTLKISIDEQFNIKLLGPTEKVACGILLWEEIKH